MKTCREPEIIKRQTAIFREVSDDLASRLEKATGIKGYDGISCLVFNGCHNGLASDSKTGIANGMAGEIGLSRTVSNGAPVPGTH